MHKQSTYDEYGRVLTATDADNRTTTTSYTPATGAEATAEAVTDPMGLVTTTTYDPARDLTLTVTNPAGWVTAETYDALGRVTAVWTPGHSQGTVPADKTFSYDVSNTAPSVIATNVINDTGGYTPSETLYDSLGRAVETQAETPDGGRDITDTFYNSDNQKDLVSNSYYTTGAPSDTIVAAPDDEVPSQTGYVYDGDGRVVKQISYTFATETWETDTSYGGDYTTVVPPAGGIAQTTFTNGEGKTSAIYQYHSGAPASPSDPASDYDATTYLYTPAQQLALITDAAGNQWNYSYDLNGDQTSATDPDAGASSSTYDAAGQMLTTTDARGKTISYTYDLDGRKTAEYDTTGGAAQTGADELDSWTYDTLAKSELTSSTSYVGGTGGSAYTEGVLGYNSYGLPTGRYTTIPSSAGALAGTYKQGLSYNAYGDLQSSYSDQAAGGLPAETVETGYDTANDPVSVGSSLWYYVASLSYTELGQPQEYAFGTTNEPAWDIDSYNQETNQLSTSQVQTGVSPVTVDATTYGYDNYGNITSESDTPASGPAQVQCFSYDYLGRLVQAWAQGSAGCASTPSQSAEGGAAPYWESYAYNAENNMTSETSTPASGAATTTTNSYPAPGTAQPHALTAQATSGSAGKSTTSYGYNADGDTTTAASPSATQNLTWNDAGQLTSVATTGANAGTTSYVYDASGDLLLQTDPGTLTLYLPDEQLVDNTATGTVTGTRYYTLGGVTVAARTSAGDVQYLTGNEQGTDTLAIDYSTLNVTRRYYDPYGNPVGTAPASWSGTKGFVGGTADPATGLTNLGAREYNPGTGAFISPDSLITAYNPQDLNAYAYGADNPATNSDPSGQMLCDGDICASLQYFEHHPSVTDSGGGGGGSGGGGGGGGGYTNPNVWDPVWHYGPPLDHLSPAFYDPPPPPVHRTVRAVTTTQRSTGLPACQGGRAEALDPQPCTPAIPRGGGGNPFSWIGSGARFLWNHTFVQGAVCFVACVSLSFQGGHFFFTLQAFSITYLFKNKPSAFAGISAGFNSATPAEVDKNNRVIGGGIADGWGGGAGVTGYTPSQGGLQDIRPYVYGTFGAGWQVQMGAEKNWEFW
jgi:RHS repeat-associated protein